MASQSRQTQHRFDFLRDMEEMMDNIGEVGHDSSRSSHTVNRDRFEKELVSSEKKGSQSKK